jgi:AraC-like DNA-binding protein
MDKLGCPPKDAMPIYMDLHITPGVTAREVAEAHLLDVKIQDTYCCKAMTYWMDEDKGHVFCLIEAPDRESVREMHKKAHGLIPHEIIVVNPEIVKAFLGRIQDPEKAIVQPETKLKVFNDTAFRILLLTKTMDSRLLNHRLGKERAQELLLLYSTIVREQSRNYGGSEVYGREEGFVISFTSHTQALDCAIAIQKRLSNTAALIQLNLALHAGVPVDKDESIFGSTIRFAQFISSFSKQGQVILSGAVRNEFKDNDWNLVVGADNTRTLSTADENFLETLLKSLTKNWQNPDFDVLDFCEEMSLSKSQLYRKCVSITGLSPNALLREYRLTHALKLLRKEEHNIAQTTFDTGFSSASYFTKCFQKRFGLQPLSYVKGKNQ